MDMRGCKQLEIGGEARIIGGTATTYGGNLCIFVDRIGKSGLVTMTGGTVEGGAAQYGDNVFVVGQNTSCSGTFVLTGGTIGAGGAGSGGNSIYLYSKASILELGNATVKGGIYGEKGTVILKGAPTVDKTGTSYTYGIKLGSAMDLAGMTGGTVYVTATAGNVIGVNASKDLSANVRSEVSTATVVYSSADKTLTYKTK
jgi:hypothetical protein